MGLGGQHHGENVVAEVADVLALEVHVLKFKPIDESGNAFVEAAVAANFDACGHGAGEGVDAAAADEVSAEGADAEKRVGHDSRVGVEAFASCPGILHHVPPSSTVSSRNP